MHRFVWDLRYTPVQLRDPSYSMATVFGQNAPSQPEGPLALPGTYKVRLTVDGQTFTQPLQLVLDPRVGTSAKDLERQFVLATKLRDALQKGNQTVAEIRSFYTQNRGSETAATKLQALSEIEPPEGTRARRGVPTISGTIGALAQLSNAVESADAAPTVAETEAVEKALAQLKSLLKRWEDFKK
jgi:hypothetical protein